MGNDRAYHDYITLEDSPWHDVRRIVLDRAQGECERCGQRRKLEVHHWTYENLFDEDPDTELEALCSRCHRSADFIRRQATRRRIQLLRATAWEWAETLPYEIWAKKKPATASRAPRATPKRPRARRRRSEKNAPQTPPAWVPSRAQAGSVIPPPPAYDFRNEPESQNRRSDGDWLRLIAEGIRFVWTYPYTDLHIIWMVSVFAIVAMIIAILVIPF